MYHVYINQYISILCNINILYTLRIMGSQVIDGFEIQENAAKKTESNTYIGGSNDS